MRTLLSFLFTGFILISTAQQNTETFYFNFGTADLTKASEQKAIQWIKDFSKQDLSLIIIKGYTDIIGTQKYNNKLSLERAQTIMKLLKGSVAPGIEIKATGLGTSNLLTTKNDEQNLNRRVEIQIFTTRPITAKTAQNQVLNLDAFKEDVMEQRFNIDLSDTVRVTAKGGTSLKIPPGSIQDKKGFIVSGKALLLIKEYYNPSDILLAGLSSASDEGLLQSGGMFKILIIHQGDTMDALTKKNVEIRMPISNDGLDKMSVFTTHSSKDTASWNYTGNLFSQMTGYWQFPNNRKFNDVTDFSNYNYYSTMPIGRSYDFDYLPANPLIDFQRLNRPYAKKVSINIVKKDSNTLSVHAKIKYRGRGRRALGISYIDTTFLVKYSKSEYIGISGNLNWINCDRLFQPGKRIDFYISTPGNQGSSVMIYFKSINSFLQAYYKNGRYVVNNVPENLPAVIISIGKKDGDFYFGKQDFVTSSNVVAKIDMQKITQEIFREKMKNL